MYMKFWITQTKYEKYKENHMFRHGVSYSLFLT
jgi:hypothetical protein